MEVKHDGRSFHIADSCPEGALTRATLKRALKAHGVESFLASKKYGGAGRRHSGGIGEGRGRGDPGPLRVRGAAASGAKVLAQPARGDSCGPVIYARAFQARRSASVSSPHRAPSASCDILRLLKEGRKLPRRNAP